ncbi:hypothetical protein DFH06DRAFT_1195827, partial [Mycena polygramma]
MSAHEPHLTASPPTEMTLSPDPPSPTHRGPGRPASLSRANRALCRIVTERYDISKIALSRYLKCRLPTIDKAMANSYVDPDDTSMDNGILEGDPAYPTVLKALLDEQNRAANDPSVPDNRSDFKGPQRHTRRVDYAKTPRATAAPPYRLRSSPSVSAAPSGASLSESDFLIAFVARTALDEDWHTKLENKGFTQAKMRAVAKLASCEVENIITKLFPEAFQLDRFLLVAAVKALDC